MEKYDLAVIGGGPGGYPAAIRAAQLGASVALIEKEYLGGTCLNWGCIPTKTLIAASSFYARARTDLPPGLTGSGISFDYKAMMANKNNVVLKLRNGINQLLKSNKINLFQATASFEGRNRLLLRELSGKESGIEARFIIIATGCKSDIPSFLPHDEKIIDSRVFLDLEKLPEKLIVMGGGMIGCEIACLAAQLGVEVTIVEILEDILMILDKDIRTELRRSLEKKLKVTILTGKPFENISCSAELVKGTYDGKPLEADLVLCATGRRPDISELKLENCGLKPDAKGFIEVDKDYRTSAANIFAVGDVNGKYQLAHAATAQGIMAVEAALDARKVNKTYVVPSCIFTSPEIGTAGLSELEASASGRKVITGKFPFMALGKAISLGETAGLVKWIADPGTGQLLGAAVVGAHATELIAEATLAIQSEQTHEDLARIVHAHPTMSEAWMEAAHAVGGHCIHLPPGRKAEL